MEPVEVQKDHGYLGEGTVSKGELLKRSIVFLILARCPYVTEVLIKVVGKPKLEDKSTKEERNKEQKSIHKLYCRVERYLCVDIE